MQSTDVIDGKDDFVVYTPGCVKILDDLVKSEAELETLRPIGGTCSTERLDRQDEQVLARGLDFNEFVEHGYFNDNHKQDTHAILGWPTLAELRKGQWHTEGNLLTGYEPADRIWNLAKALAKSTTKRRLGFSIEGKVVDRDHNNRILKAKIRHVAITNSPVNTDCTWGILAKAFGSIAEIDAGTIRRKLSGDRDLNVLSFDQSVKLIKSARPHYDWSTCERVARVIYKQHERRI